MEVVISTHFDLAHPVMFIKLDQVKLSGLVDNFAGIFTAYAASRKTQAPLYLTNYEEIDYDGAIEVAKELDKNMVVIVVDTVTNIQNHDAFIGNVYNLNVKPFVEKFPERVSFKEGYFEETEDETFIYGKKNGFKTLYFGVPIPNGYHDVDNFVAIEQIDRSTAVLIDLINWLQNL